MTIPSDIPLVSGRWYACDPNPPTGGVQRIGLTAGTSGLPHRVAGPFVTEVEAEEWLKLHPGEAGPYGRAVQFRR